jgi:hypothetical protein
MTRRPVGDARVVHQHVHLPATGLHAGPGLRHVVAACEVEGLDAVDVGLAVQALAHGRGLLQPGALGFRCGQNQPRTLCGKGLGQLGADAA